MADFQQAVDDSQRSEIRSLGEKLAAFQTSIASLIERNHADTKDQLTELRRDTRERMDKFDGRLNDHEERLSRHSERITRVEERQSVLAVVQLAYTTVASAIAAFLGGGAR